MGKIALISGSTGLVGGYLLDYLLESDDYERVISLVRKPSGKSHPKLRERLVSFSELSSLVLKSEVDDLFCCLGTTMKKAKSRKKFLQVDFDYPVQFGELGLKHSAKRMFIVSSLGANRNSVFFYSRVKGKMENALKELAFEAIGIFRPALILGERKEQRMGEEFAKKVTSFVDPMLVMGLKKYKGVQASLIAKSIMQLASTNFQSIKIIESEDIRQGII